MVRFNTIMIEVVPVFMHPNHRFTMPDTNNGGNWKTADPFAQSRLIELTDHNAAGNLRTMAKMMKVWKREHKVPLKSFVLELLLADFMSTYQHKLMDYYYYDWFVRDFLSFLVAKAGWWLTIPGTGEIYWLGDEWKPKAEAALAAARTACHYEYNDWTIMAGEEWQKIFGPRILVYV